MSQAERLSRLRRTFLFSFVGLFLSVMHHHFQYLRTLSQTYLPRTQHEKNKHLGYRSKDFLTWFSAKKKRLRIVALTSPPVSSSFPSCEHSSVASRKVSCPKFKRSENKRWGRWEASVPQAYFEDGHVLAGWHRIYFYCWTQMTRRASMYCIDWNESKIHFLQTPLQYNC